MGYDMPNLSEDEAISSDQLVKEQISTPLKERSVVSEAQGCPSRANKNEHPCATNRTVDMRPIQRIIDQPRAHSQASSLIRDSSGSLYFIGPSGTLSFFAELRHLVASREKDIAHGNPGSTSHFAHDDTAMALEADEPHEANEADSAELAAAAGPSPQSEYSVLTAELSGPAKPDMSLYLNHLPPQHTMDTLVESYFTKIHAEFPIFHRATFEDELELYVVRCRNIKAPKPPHGSHPSISQSSGPDWGWLACLHLVLLLGSLGVPQLRHSEFRTLRRDCLSTVRLCLPHLVNKCTTTNVQALLLQSLFLHNNNNRNGAWNLLGTATRISFALGLHRDDLGTAFRPIERELRKRIFCTLYGFENFLSSSLGRPSGLNEFDVEVQAPRDGFLDDSTGASSKFTTASLKLQRILGQTRAAIARLKARLENIHLLPFSVDESSSSPAPDEEILEQLDMWQQHLPSHLSIQSVSSVDGIALPRRSSISATSVDLSLEELKTSLSRQTTTQLRALIMLHIQYHYIALLVTRPTLLWEVALSHSRGNSRSGSQGPAVTDSNGADCAAKSAISPKVTKCRYHACQLVALVVLLDRFRLLDGVSSLDLFYAYCAALALILSLLRTPRSASSADRSSIVENQVIAEEQKLQDSIRSLIGILRSTTATIEKCATMKRMIAVMNKFADSVIKDEDYQNTLHADTSNSGAENRPAPKPWPRSQVRTRSRQAASRRNEARPKEANRMSFLTNEHRRGTRNGTLGSFQSSRDSPSFSSPEASDAASPEPVEPEGAAPLTSPDGRATRNDANYGGPSGSISAATNNFSQSAFGSVRGNQRFDMQLPGNSQLQPGFSMPGLHGNFNDVSTQYTTSTASELMSSSNLEYYGPMYPGRNVTSHEMGHINQPLPNSSFWYDPLGPLTEGQFLDWADLENFLTS